MWSFKLTGFTSKSAINAIGILHSYGVVGVVLVHFCKAESTIKISLSVHLYPTLPKLPWVCETELTDVFPSPLVAGRGGKADQKHGSC